MDCGTVYKTVYKIVYKNSHHKNRFNLMFKFCQFNVDRKWLWSYRSVYSKYESRGMNHVAFNSHWSNEITVRKGVRRINLFV